MPRPAPILLVLYLACGATAPAVLVGAPSPQAPVPAVQPQSGLEPFTAEDMLRVSTLSILDVSDDGRWVAIAARRPHDNAETNHFRYGDPTYQTPNRVTPLVIDTTSGRTWRPFDGLAHVAAAKFSPDGARLALLIVDDDPAPGEPGVAVSAGRLKVWDVERATLIGWSTGGPRLDPSSGLDWRPGTGRVVAALRDAADDAAARSRFKALIDGPVIVHASKEPFLEWDDLRRSASRRSLAEIDVATGAVTEVLSKRLVRSYRAGRDGSFLTVLEDVTEKTDYDTIGGRITDLLVVAPPDQPRKVVDGKELKGVELRWSDDGRTFAYAKKGEVFVQRIDDEKPRSVTPKPKKEEGDAASAAAVAEQTDEESFTPQLFSRDASRLLVTSKKGWYVVSVSDATRRPIVTFDEDHEERNPRLQPIDWTPDGQALLVGYSAPDAWARGVVRIDAASGRMDDVFKDAGLYRGFRLSRDGTTLVYARSDGDRPDEVLVTRLDRTDAAAGPRTRQLTEVNAWTARKALPRSELVTYRDADGKTLRGVLRYPVGYEKGKTYPTVFEIYETFFDNGFNGRAAFLANHGYAVFHPSVNLVVGRPGESWLKGVTAAANKLVDMGVADPDRLGVHGTSYGGYATVLLISQTDRFKAAINVSGKVNMVSFYTDSPRLGVRNTHAPEKSQDRIGGTLWEYPERYLEHSAVLRADRIRTPLLCITGDQDPNVPASQSREIYYALRRLGREVEWVRYTNGGHRPPNSVAESVDFEQRILDWYEKYLKPSK